MRSVALPPWSRRLETGTGVLLLVIAAFVLFGLRLLTLVDAMGPHPSRAAYLDAPTAFWVVKFYDLGIVVPGALVVGVGVLRSRRWARTCGLVAGFTTLAGALSVFAGFLYRPLLVASATSSREHRSRRRTVRSTSVGR